MKQGYRNRANKLSRIAEERILELFRQADIRFKKQPELSDRYVELAKKISTRHKVKMPAALKKRFCKHCMKYLVPGANLRVRINDRKMVYYCISCKGYMRFPYSKKKAI